MNIALIGGTGLIGPYLVPKLVAAGHSVTCLNRRGTSIDSNSVKCDRRVATDLRRVIRDLRPDTVIDMVPYSQADADSLCGALQDDEDVHVIAISSIDVYLAYGRIHRTETGPYQKCPIQENDELREKLSFQGEDYDKLGIERIYRSQFENLSILRMPAIYGWPDRSRVSQYYEAVAKGDGTLRMNPEFAKWGFTRASAQDCAHAISLTLNQMGRNIYNVGEEELLSEEEWCRLVWKASGIKGEIIFDEDVPIPYNADLNQGWHVDTQKIRSELGFSERIDRMDVLRQTIEKIREVEPDVPYNSGQSLRD